MRYPDVDQAEWLNKVFVAYVASFGARVPLHHQAYELCFVLVAGRI